ncbi:DUF2125 domain-containing protein [Phaeobacter sp. C3_T13_0]|uniref:DUF2125 domain-containing protein n=1 Tax=Phaeobacter cretensis TaxID=3342641 RepID=UPI0039BC2669
MMIRWTKLVLIAALALGLYWALTAWGLRQGIEGWFAEQQRQGWQAEYAELYSSGFPLRHVHRITAPALADPGTGAAWRADWLEIRSTAIWPGNLTLLLPDTTQRVSYFDDTATIRANDLRADLQLAPGLALEMEQLSLRAQHWSAQGKDDVDLEGQSLSLEMQQMADPNVYQISGSAGGLTPSPLLRQRLAAAEGLPDRLETITLDMAVRFDTSWDRNVIELRRPQPRHIILRLAETRWGPMRLKATGELTIDETGQPDGKLALQVENWQDILHMAEASGALHPSARLGVERVLRVFARLGGNHRDLDLSLTFSSGFATLGPIPIGPAPRLILR